MTISAARRSALTGLSAVLFAGVLASASPAPVAAAGGAELVSHANGYRANAGVAAVSLDADVERIANERAEQVRAAGQLGHDFEYIKRRFADLGVCWRAFGEIVASNSTGSYATFTQQWYNSAVHRAVMLGAAYNVAGGSHVTGGGRHYGLMIFVQRCNASTPPAPAPTPGGFTDINGSPFVADIVWLVEAGITNGCGSSRFCPRDPVTREQMASFLSRGLHLPAAGSDWFWDDNGSIHEPDINRVASAGITHGCGDGRYCPGQVVTREQMASFLARALNLPASSRDWFTDDNGSGHEAAINSLADAGITLGCGTGVYCPGHAVTREQMAAFLHRALG